MEKNFCPVAKKGSIFHSDKANADLIVVNRTKYFVDVQEVGSDMLPFRVKLDAPEMRIETDEMVLNRYGEPMHDMVTGEPVRRKITAWDESKPMIMLDEYKKAFNENGKLYTYKRLVFNLK